MALTDPTQAITTEMNDISYAAGQEPWNKNSNYAVNIESRETETNNYIPDWKKWHGIYRKIPEASSTIDVYCKWLIGKKLKVDEKTKKIIDRIRGNGKDTFRKILLNVKRTSKICGDGFAEIVKDKAGRLINLKPLDPGTLMIEYDSSLMIKKYWQVANKDPSQKIGEGWNPEEIFHISNNRIADEIHGIPETEKLYERIRWSYQINSVLSVVFFRYVKPTLDIYAKTDDPTELSDLQTMYDKSQKNFENRIIPAGSIEKVDRVSIPQYSTLDPLPWLKSLNNEWPGSTNVPDVIRGKSTEVSLAAGKLNYLGYKERLIAEQIEFSEEIKSQLNLDIGFEEPTEIDIELGMDMIDKQVTPSSEQRVKSVEKSAKSASKVSKTDPKQN